MRDFERDMEQCPNCGGELKIIGVLMETPLIEKILMRLGSRRQLPPRSPAREHMPFQAA